MILFAKPQVWNERDQPCFAPGLASKIFLRGIQKYAPQPPSHPKRALSGGFMSRQGGFWKNEAKEIKRKCDLFLHIRAGAWGGKFSLPAQILFEGAIGADIHAPVASVAALNVLGEADAIPFGVLKQVLTELLLRYWFFQIVGTPFVIGTEQVG